MTDEMKFVRVFVLVVIILGRRLFGPRTCIHCDGSGIYAGIAARRAMVKASDDRLCDLPSVTAPMVVVG
jgi:hypothetical protein